VEKEQGDEQFYFWQRKIGAYGIRSNKIDGNCRSKRFQNDAYQKQS
jgi:hypothetical protein